jgi:hypothetical protein
VIGAGSTRARVREPAVQNVHPLGDQKRLRGEALVGVGVVGRVRAHAPALGRLAECSAEVPGEGVAGLGVRGHEERRRIPQLRDQLRCDDGSCAAAQSRKTHGYTALDDSPSDLVEILLDRLASGGLFHPDRWSSGCSAPALHAKVPAAPIE